MASRRTIPIKADVVLHKRCTRVAHALHMCYTSVAQAFHKRCPSVTQALPKRYPSVTQALHKTDTRGWGGVTARQGE
eukprot:816236-Prorocentrum_minimum.AAC.10